jgi:uncharacterized membrane protein YczE
LIEVCVLVAGWLLGGTVGVGTVLHAVAIGLLVPTRVASADERVLLGGRIASAEGAA